MATRSDAHVVKSLNKSSGRQRFVFKKFSQRIAEIDIDVYRSLEPLNAEPSAGSSFFRDCLVQWRELNTAEDFISFYEEMFPLVQTLPQIILQKELILSKLLSRVQMKSRLSLEPILRLIAALSRDLLEDFVPFLQRIVSTLVFLLKGGADREPEIMEQIFSSWSCIMMYLQKYLTKDVVHVLKVTSRLRFYPKDYVQEFMAESVSFVLRNAPTMQLVKGIRKVLIEVAKKRLDVRKSGVIELLWYVMRGTSSRLHSRAQQVLQLLMDKSIFNIHGRLIEGSESVLEVLNSVFHRLSLELEPAELNLVWNGLFAEIMDSVTSNCPVHVHRLLSLLLSTMQNGYVRKMSDYQPVIQVVGLLLETHVTPCTRDAENQSTELTDRILHLLLCILDGLCEANDLSTLSRISVQWESVFNLRNTSLLKFLKDLLAKDIRVLHVFQLNIISALNDLIEIYEEEVIYLLLIFCENLQMPISGFFDGIPKEKLSRICSFIHQNFSYWIGMINNAVHGNLSPLVFLENGSRLAVLWGTIRCYPYLVHGQEGLSMLMNLLNALEDLFVIESGFPKSIWQSLIGATLDSYRKVLCSDGSGNDGSAVSKFLYLAKKYSSSSQILSSVADTLDSLYGSLTKAQNTCKTYHLELDAVNLVDALKTFAENLSHPDRLLRLSTLRILCHYESLKLESSSQEQSDEKKLRDGVLQTCQGANVLELLLLIEATPLSVDTSRKVILLLSKIHMIVSATRMAEDYIPALLYGIIGIFHKRFSYLWNQAIDCLAVLINQHFEIVWDKCIRYLDHCESMFLISQDQSGKSGAELLKKPSDLVGHFNSFLIPTSDSTPCATVFLLLIQTLQKVPRAESRSRDIVPLFLRFLGYSVNDLMSVETYDLRVCKGKEWKGTLKEWLNLFGEMKNPKFLYQSQFFRDVLQYRLLDNNDAEVQMKVLDCLLNWKDGFLVPYTGHLKNLINAKSLREEVTTWSLSRESNLIDELHRSAILPIVIQILVPKVRKPKTLASRKHASVCHRKAILGFLAHLDIEELPLFFALLIKPLQTVPEGADATSKLWWSPSDSLKDGSHSLILQQFTTDGIKAISWKKRYGFLHVIEEVLEVFDEWHTSPFIDLLMGCVVRILESTTTLKTKSSGLSLIDSASNISVAENDDEMETDIMSSTSVKQFKEMRSLCLKIISSTLGKYESYDFGCEFWDRFFVALKPLIAGFKQEGASSERPSSLFSCFLAMSRSIEFVPLLSREKYLVSDIFSMLTITSASDAIVSAVFKFVENLLSLDSELGDDNSPVKIILLPHLNVLVCSLHSLFTHDNATKRKAVRYLGEKELIVFKLLSKYIKEPLAAMKFIDILLPLLARRSQKISDSCVDILQIIQHVVKVVGSESSEKIITSVSPLLTSAGLEVRVAVCDVLNALSESDISVLTVAKLLSELNATSAMEIGGLDYDIVIGAYEKINKDLFYALQKEHMFVLLSHAVHDMSSEEMILRQSAYGLLVCFVEFAGEIMDGKEVTGRGCWSEAGVKQIVSNFILTHMGNAMSKETFVQKVWIDLLREMALKLPKVANLESYGTLYSQDPEQDFFSNIIHLQKHRKARALSRFSHAVSSGNLSQVITNRVFIPLFFSMLFDLQHGKGENVRSACLEALASISSRMSWKQYYPLLNRCFREMTIKPDKQKVLLRLICSILDQFHFSVAEFNQETVDCEEKELGRVSFADQVTDIQTCLQKTILPKIQKLLNSDSENMNVNVSLVALKLLKLLPGETMDLQLPSIIHRISNFLKNRLVSVRDEARLALASCLRELGLEYLQFIVKVLRGTLKRGYELHVLGYTLNFLLSKFPANSVSGKLDYCLDDLLSVIENDIFGDVSEQKEEEKFASKMKEARKEKSFETLKLIAQSITFRTHALKLLSPITVHLQKQLNPKLKTKLESMLNHIAVGIESNLSVNMTELFIFAYRLIKDGIDDEEKNAHISTAAKRERNEVGIGINNLDRLVEVDSRYSHFITVFALGLLQNYMKNLKLSPKNGELLSLLDPFIGLLCACLSSKYENIVSTALRCLSPLVKLPLPSLESEADKIKNSLLVIAQGSWNARNAMMESCLRLLTVLLHNTRITLSADQLHMLIQFPLFVDIERNPSFVALSLFKAVVNRKLVVPEIYDVVKRVAELMVRSQDEPVRKQCSKILLQFLLDYHLSEKRLQQHIDFLVANLKYEHSTGREAVLEMLHAIIMKFPASVVDGQSQTLFVHLVVCLANDPDNKVRSMTGAVIKLLIGRVGPHSLHSITKYSLSWYLDEKQHLWSAAAQVLGLLVEVTKSGFHLHISSVLPVMQRILQSGVNVLIKSPVDASFGGPVSLWKEAYYSLVMLEKILHQFSNLCFEKDLEEIWEIICQLLVHPHLWLRNISNRLLAFYFAHVTESCRETLFLMRPARLFLIAASFCCQLKTQLTDEAAITLIEQNLVFAICHLSSDLGQNDYMDFPKLWLDLGDSEQGQFLKAFELLDSRKGKSTVAYLTSDPHGQYAEQKSDRNQSFVISYLLKKMGKISLEKEDLQMRSIFNCFKSISANLLSQNKSTARPTDDDMQNYAYQILFPLYKVSEGYAGKTISEDDKLFAEGIRDSIRDNMGILKYVDVCHQIEKNLKVKRDKRKQEEKLMAVVNPMRNAKRKLRIAAKHRANKKRKIMTLKTARWMR